MFGGSLQGLGHRSLPRRQRASKKWVHPHGPFLTDAKWIPQASTVKIVIMDIVNTCNSKDILDLGGNCVRSVEPQECSHQEQMGEDTYENGGLSLKVQLEQALAMGDGHGNRDREYYGL